MQEMEKSLIEKRSCEDGRKGYRGERALEKDLIRWWIYSEKHMEERKEEDIYIERDKTQVY